MEGRVSLIIAFYFKETAAGEVKQEGCLVIDSLAVPLSCHVIWRAETGDRVQSMSSNRKTSKSVPCGMILSCDNFCTFFYFYQKNCFFPLLLGRRFLMELLF